MTHKNMNHTARIAAAAPAKSNDFSVVEEGSYFDATWTIRDRKGEVVATCQNVRDAERIADLLNRQARREI